MIFEFFFSFNQLNLFFLTFERKEQIKEEIKLVKIEVVEIFKYGKNNDKQWDGTELYKQVVNKALPIA